VRFRASAWAFSFAFFLASNREPAYDTDPVPTAIRRRRPRCSSSCANGGPHGKTRRGCPEGGQPPTPAAALAQVCGLRARYPEPEQGRAEMRARSAIMAPSAPRALKGRHGVRRRRRANLASSCPEAARQVRAACFQQDPYADPARPEKVKSHVVHRGFARATRSACSRAKGYGRPSLLINVHSPTTPHALCIPTDSPPLLSPPPSTPHRRAVANGGLLWGVTSVSPAVSPLARERYRAPVIGDYALAERCALWATKAVLTLRCAWRRALGP